MNLFQRVWDSIGLSDRFDETEYEYEYEEDVPSEFYPPEAMYSEESVPVNNVVGMPNRKLTQTEMCLMEPRSFEEMPQVVVALRERKSVILNLSLMDADVAQRCVDFVAGAAFAIDGHQERLGEHIFLFTPSFVQISSYPSLAQPAQPVAQVRNVSVGAAAQPTQITPPAPTWTSQPPRMVQ